MTRPISYFAAVLLHLAVLFLTKPPAFHPVPVKDDAKYVEVTLSLVAPTSGAQSDTGSASNAPAAASTNSTAAQPMATTTSSQDSSSSSTAPSPPSTTTSSSDATMTSESPRTPDSATAIDSPTPASPANAAPAPSAPPAGDSMPSQNSPAPGGSSLGVPTPTPPPPAPSMAPSKPVPEAPIYYPVKQDPRLGDSESNTPHIVFIQGAYEDVGPPAQAAPAPAGPSAPGPVINIGHGGGSIKPGNIGTPGQINTGPRQINPGPTGPSPRSFNPQPAPRPRTINNPPPVNSNPIESQPIDTTPISVGGDVTPDPLDPQPLHIGELHPPKLDIGQTNSTLPPPAPPPPNPAPPANTDQVQYWQSTQAVIATPPPNDQPQVELIPNTPVQWTGAPNSNGHYYQSVYAPKGVNWETARSFAASRGGYLATIGSQAENTFVFGLVDDPKYWQVTSTSENAGPWIGGFRTGDDWQWTNDNSKLGYVHWVIGEPGGINLNQDRLHFYSTSSFQRASFWDATNGGNLMLGFVVEYEKDPSARRSRPSG